MGSGRPIKLRTQFYLSRSRSVGIAAELLYAGGGPGQVAGVLQLSQTPPVPLPCGPLIHELKSLMALLPNEFPDPVRDSLRTEHERSVPAWELNGSPVQNTSQCDSAPIREGRG